MAFDPTQIPNQIGQFGSQIANQMMPTPPEAQSNYVLSPLVSGNYVSPEQAAQMRLYANALNKNAMTMPVKNGWQGLAQMANAGIGGLLSGYADKQQRDLINENVNRVSTPLYNSLGAVNGAGDNPQPQTTTNNDQQLSPDTQNSSRGQAAPLADPSQYPNTPAGHDAFNRAYAVSQGVDPSLVHGLTMAEGLMANTPQNPNGASYVDREKDGTPFSFGDFQLNVHKGALGDMARKAGIDPADPNQWQAANKFAIDYMKNNDLTPWRTDKAVEAYRAASGNGYATPRIPPNPNVSPIQTAGQGVQVASNGPIPAGAVPTPPPRPPDIGGAPSASAYGSNATAPAVAAINNSAPVAPAPVIPPATAQGSPSPYQIAALRGNRGLSPAMMATISSDPTATPEQKQLLNSMVAPQMVQGPFGSTSITSMNGALNGAAPIPFANPGMIQTTELPGGMKVPGYYRYDPRSGQVNSSMMMPGVNMGVGGQPAPAPTAAPPAGRNDPAPTAAPPPQVVSGGQPPPTPQPQGNDQPTPTTAPVVPGTPGGPAPTMQNMVQWGNDMENYKKRQEDQAKSDTAAYQDANTRIKSTQDFLNQLQVYKAAKQELKASGGSLALGPMEPRAKELMGLANSLGFSTQNGQEALAALESMEKTSGQMVLSKLGNTPGLSGHSTDSLRQSITQMTPNPLISDTGNDRVADTLERSTKLDQLYYTKKEQWMSAHNLSTIDNQTGTNFDREWSKAIQGKGTDDPILKDVQPQQLSTIPLEPPKPIAGSTDMLAKIPSTRERGYDIVRIHGPKQ